MKADTRSFVVFSGVGCLAAVAVGYVVWQANAPATKTSSNAPILPTSFIPERTTSALTPTAVAPPLVGDPLLPPNAFIPDTAPHIAPTKIYRPTPNGLGVSSLVIGEPTPDEQQGIQNFIGPRIPGNSSQTGRGRIPSNTETDSGSHRSGDAPQATPVVSDSSDSSDDGNGQESETNVLPQPIPNPTEKPNGTQPLEPAPVPVPSPQEGNTVSSAESGADDRKIHSPAMESPAMEGFNGHDASGRTREAQESRNLPDDHAHTSPMNTPADDDATTLLTSQDAIPRLY